MISEMDTENRENWGEVVEKDQLEGGDHIFYDRAEGIYSHHGIYDKKYDTVIHFDWRDHKMPPIKTGKDYSHCPKCPEVKSRVRESCVDCFMLGRDQQKKRILYRYGYSKTHEEVKQMRAGSCTTLESNDAEIVLRRARELCKEGKFLGKFTFGGHGGWRLWNNCESFAIYCKTGHKEMGAQIKRLPSTFVRVVVKKSLSCVWIPVPGSKVRSKDSDQG